MSFGTDFMTALTDTSSGVMSGIGQFSQAFGLMSNVLGAKKQAEAINQANARNAQLAEWQAQDALKRGTAEEQRMRLRTAQIKGTQRAEMAARGLSLAEGTPQDILTTTDYMGNRDALTVRDNAIKQAWGYRVQAANYKAADVSPSAAATAAFMTGAATVAPTWLKFNEQYDKSTGVKSSAWYAGNPDYMAA